MIDLIIHRDPAKCQAKLVGPFTARQTVCIMIAAPFCWAIYHFSSPYIPPDVAGFLVIIPAAVAMAFGWLRPFGMPTEKFIKSVFVDRYLAPHKRRYKTVNHYEQVFARVESMEPPKKKQKYKPSKQGIK